MGSGEPLVSGITYSDVDYRGESGSAGAPEERARPFRAAHVAVNVVLAVAIALCAWVGWQEAFSAMPAADSVRAVLPGTAHADALTDVRVEGKDVVLVYDLSGQAYFDEQERYAGEFEEAAKVVLDDFRRVQRVRVTIVQGSERYEGISVTDGFGKILEWF